MLGATEYESPASASTLPGESGAAPEATTSRGGWRDVACPFTAEGAGWHWARYRASAGPSGTFLCTLCDLQLTGAEVAALVGESVERFLARQPGLVELDREALLEIEKRTERTMRRSASNSELAELVFAWAAGRFPRESAPAVRAAILRGAQRALRTGRAAA